MSVPPPKTRRLLIDTTQLSVATILNFGVSFFASVLIPKILDPVLFGVWKTFQVVLQYTGHSHLGLLNATLKEGPGLYAREDRGHFRHLTGAVYTSITLLSLVEAAGMVIGAWWNRSDPLMALALGILAFTVPLQQSQLFCEIYMNITKRFRLKSQAMVGLAILRTGLMLGALYWLGFGWFLGAMGVSLALIVAWIFHKTGFRPAWRFDFAETKRLLLVGLPIFGIVWTETLIQTTDKIVTASVLGMQEMGYYGIAGIVMPLILLVPISLRQVVSVEVYHQAEAAGGSLKPVRDLFNRSLQSLALLMPLAGGIAYLGSDWGLRFFLTKYLPGLTALKVMCFAVMPLTLTHITFCYLVVARLEFYAIRAGLLAAGVNTALTLGVLGFYKTSLALIALIHGGGYLLFAILLVGKVDSLLEEPVGWGGQVRRVTIRMGKALLPWVYTLGATLLLERLGPAGDAPDLTGIRLFGWSVLRMVLLLVASAPLGYSAWRMVRSRK